MHFYRYVNHWSLCIARHWFEIRIWTSGRKPRVDVIDWKQFVESLIESGVCLAAERASFVSTALFDLVRRLAMFREQFQHWAERGVSAAGETRKRSLVQSRGVAVMLTMRLNIDDVLEHSYRDFHAKGLDYVCVRRSPDETLKLYFFDGDVATAPEVVCPHDHRYDFDTRVLAGAVENVLYEHVGGDLKPGQHAWTYNRFEWRTPLLPGPSGFTFAGVCALTETSRTRYGGLSLARHGGRERRYYSMRADQIHTLRIVERRTVLMLIQYQDVVPENVPTSTYSRGDAPKLDGLYRRFTADEIVAKLRDFEERAGIRLEMNSATTEAQAG